VLTERQWRILSLVAWQPEPYEIVFECCAESDPDIAPVTLLQDLFALHQGGLLILIRLRGEGRTLPHERQLAPATARDIVSHCVQEFAEFCRTRDFIRFKLMDVDGEVVQVGIPFGVGAELTGLGRQELGRSEYRRYWSAESAEPKAAADGGGM
jgi:hypothetical protein